MERKSDISGFHELPPKERLEIVKKFANLTREEAKLLQKTGALDGNTADMMIENVIGTTELPLGIATNFLINGKDYLIPMAIEEPSVVAAASNSAKMARMKGGFTASCTDPIIIGQIQVLNVQDPYGARMSIISNKEKILRKANDQDPILVSKGGGAKDLRCKVLKTFVGNMVIIELRVDCREAMGAKIGRASCRERV